TLGLALGNTLGLALGNTLGLALGNTLGLALGNTLGLGKTDGTLAIPPNTCTAGIVFIVLIITTILSP
ncbi:MAG: hypothetical protein RR292_07385, partial [Christensenellaceae bacterium]